MPEIELTSMDFPKISIVTPSFNQGAYLEDTIKSVLDQAYPNLEYIIIDGDSSDGSVDIIRKYEKHLHYWVSEPDRGQSHAINKGFEKATGDILGWLNSDDTYVSGALNVVAENFQAHPGAGAVVGAGDMTDGINLLTMQPFPVTVEALYGWHDQFFMQPSCFFTCEAWRYCGPLSEDVEYAMDLDLWFRIAKKYQFLLTPQNLSVSLIHPHAKTTAFAGKSIVDVAMVIMAHGGAERAKERLGKYLAELYEKRAQVLGLGYTIGDLQHMLAERDQMLVEKSQTIAERNSHIEALSHNVAALSKEAHALRNSLSWTVTRPLRWLGQKLVQR